MPASGYEFEKFRFDAAAHRVTRDDGRVIDLEPKALEVLCFFLEHPGRLVRKEELLDAAWKNVAVTPNALTRVIAQLRRELGDDAQQARIIETVPTLGYRFLPSVRPFGASSASASVLPADLTLPSEPVPSAESTVPLTPTPPTHRESPVDTSPAAVTRRNPRVLLALAAMLLAALAGAGWWLTSRAPVELTDPAAPVRVGSTEHQFLHPALSPDGARLAFVSNQSGSFELFVRRLDRDGEPDVALTSDGLDSTQPAWSPDGRTIAFTRRDGGIWVVASEGGAPRQIAAFGAAPSWSPDGRQIVFQSESARNALATIARPGSTLWRVAATGGLPIQVTTVGTPEGGHSNPRWSPDGTRIFFIAFLNQLGRVWSIGVDNGVLTEAASTVQRGSALTDLEFGPGGELLTTWAERPAATAADTGSIMAFPVDALGNVTGPRRQVGPSMPRRIGQFTLARDGTRMYFTQSNLRGRLMQIPIDAQGGPLGPAREIETPREWEMVNHPAISDDGRELAFSMFTTGAGGSVWIQSLESGRPRPIVKSAAFDGYPSWIPGTSRILSVRSQLPNTYLVETDTRTGTSTVVMSLPEATAFVQVLADGDTFLANISGPTNAAGRGSLKAKTFGRWAEADGLAYPRASRDGRHVAFERASDEGYQLWVSLDGQAPRRVSTVSGEHWPWSWSPDGRFIAIASQREGIWNIWVVDPRTGAERPVTVQSDPSASLYYPEWSPVGGRIVFYQAGPTHRLWTAALPSGTWAN